MTKLKSAELPERTKRIAKAISKRMPHLAFAIWDLSDFLPAFHNVRRNMVFVECEEMARKEAMNAIASEEEFANCLIYSGERKPVSVNEDWANAKGAEIRDVIVIVSRKDLRGDSEMEGNLIVPSLERRLIDLLSYALKGHVPITVEEAASALAWFIKNGNARASKLQRYAVRKYLAWYLDILLYKLASSGRIASASIDPRYMENGKRYYEAITRVDAA